MNEERNYFPYFVYEENGEVKEWMDSTPYDCGLAYDEAIAKRNYLFGNNVIEYGLKVYTQNIFRILSWKMGECRRLQGTYLYKMRIEGK